MPENTNDSKLNTIAVNDKPTYVPILDAARGLYIIENIDKPRDSLDMIKGVSESLRNILMHILSKDIEISYSEYDSCDPRKELYVEGPIPRRFISRLFIDRFVDISELDPGEIMARIQKYWSAGFPGGYRFYITTAGIQSVFEYNWWRRNGRRVADKLYGRYSASCVFAEEIHKRANRFIDEIDERGADDVKNGDDVCIDIEHSDIERCSEGLIYEILGLTTKVQTVICKHGSVSYDELLAHLSRIGNKIADFDLIYSKCNMHRVESLRDRLNQIKKLHSYALLGVKRTCFDLGAGTRIIDFYFSSYEK